MAKLIPTLGPVNRIDRQVAFGKPNAIRVGASGFGM